MLCWLLYFSSKSGHKCGLQSENKAFERFDLVTQFFLRQQEVVCVQVIYIPLGLLSSHCLVDTRPSLLVVLHHLYLPYHAQFLHAAHWLLETDPHLSIMSIYNSTWSILIQYIRIILSSDNLTQKTQKKDLFTSLHKIKENLPHWAELKILRNGAWSFILPYYNQSL